jgi:[glutamine synthetase] adenylyltransferase / [glutamine synthetase]-adenylyl-L-tyrosine phosphorylase
VARSGVRADLHQAIERGAAPGPVAASIDQLRQAAPELDDWLADGPERGRRLVAVLAASRSLTRLVTTTPEALVVLGDVDHRAPIDAVTIERLARWKQLEFLRIAARDLEGTDDLATVGRNLADLATDVIEAACRLGGTHGLAVIGMGKLGGRELNYSSDVDLIFVGDGPPDELEAAARQVMDLTRHCFRVDANLRPEGRDGRLVRTLDSYEAYWDRWAEPWEFQALLKAEPVAGDQELGLRFHETAQRWLWSHPFSADDLRSLRAMKHRAEELVIRRGLDEREIKRGPGGIRDIEFTVQLLQLVHGHADSDIRSPNTLLALQEMTAAGYVDPADAEQLVQAHAFLRTVEHRLQLVDEQQVHTVPDEPDAIERLARVMGYRDTAAGDASEALWRDLRRQELTVRGIHERVYFRPLLEAFASTEGALSPEAAVARLVAFGFTDARRTQAAVRELTRGLNRASRLMQQMLPLMLDWLSTSPDPDLGLLQLRNLLAGKQRHTTLVEAFRESPQAAQRLCEVLGTSRLLGDTLAHNPDLVSRLPDPDRLATPARAALVDSATSATAWRSTPTERQEALRRWNDRNRFGVAARDLFGYADVSAVGRDLTTLGEAVVEVALAGLDPQVPFAVIAMGRFGGAELSFASDLDVIFVFDGSGATDAAEADRVATALLRFVGGPTPAERLYEMDADLRPEGRQGSMARSLEAFHSYWEHYALVWERQAMIRARPVAGDLVLGQRLLDLLAPAVWDGGLSAEDTREIRRLKARVERERMPAGEDPDFHLKLGRGSLSDIEFTAQLLQLRHGVTGTATVAALESLAAAGALDRADVDTLIEAYRFCEGTRNRWYLVNSSPGDSLPSQPNELLWLARSLGTTPTELREHYRRVTRRARRVVERVFYGRD